THVGGAFTVCSWASHFATPRATPSIPSVTMNGMTRSAVIATPFTMPITPPAITEANTAIQGAQPAERPTAVITPVSAIAAPTERSMPPPTTIIVMPIAPTATMTDWESTMRRLNDERYRSGAPVSTVNASTTTARPITGPARPSVDFGSRIVKGLAATPG